MVSVAAGIYPRSSAFDLEAADSGMPGSPILYRGLPGAAPRLLGGRPIRFEPVTDPEILRRLGPASSNHVRVADLRAQGVTHLGRMTSRGFGRPTVPAHLELFVGGRPMTLARWPNEGEWLRIAGFPEDSAQPDDHGGKIGDLKSGFSYDGDRPRSWAPSSNIWVHGYWAWDWANSYERVEQLDAGARRVRTASPHGLYGFRKGQRFYFLNVLEELDRPGEYCLDEGTGRLYFWPPEGGAGADDCVVSVVEAPLIRLHGASDIVLSNLVLEATRGGGIRVENGSSNRVEGCLLRNLGNWGIEISGGQGHMVRGCEVRDSGDGGVMVSGGDRRRLVPAGHRVEQSWFERQGRWSKCYVPAILIDGVGISARHNLIEAMLWNIAARALELGTNVILDYGFWAREEREDYRLRAQRLGAASEVHYLDVPADELLRRLAQRNAQPSDQCFLIAEEAMKSWIGFFQKPTPDELVRRE